MSEQRFNIVFAGELREGQDEEAARARLAAMFKSDAQRIAQLFDGRRHAVKKNADNATAQKYVAAMAKAGAIAYAEPVGGAPAPAPSSAPAPQESTAAVESTAAAQAPAASQYESTTTDAVGEFDLAPTGSDLLKESERYNPDPVQVSTDHLAVTSQSQIENLEQPPPPPAPDTSHIDLSAPGAILNEDVETQPVVEAPDTSSISIAEPGGLLVEPSEDIPVAVPDVSSISLAPPGAPLDELREEKELLNPDTSGLSLSDENDQGPAAS